MTQFHSYFLTLAFLAPLLNVYGLSPEAMAFKQAIEHQKGVEVLKLATKVLMSELMHDGLTWPQIDWVGGLFDRFSDYSAVIKDIGENLQSFSRRYQKFWATCLYANILEQRKPFDRTRPIADHERSWFYVIRDATSGMTLDDYEQQYVKSA